jgi:hypothetical protein
MVMTDVIAHVESNVAEPTTSETIDRLCITTIRTLAMDAVQAANSGHPGTPMALAPVVYWPMKWSKRGALLRGSATNQ